MTDESTSKEPDCTDGDLETLKRNLRRLTTLAVRLRRFSDAARVALQRYKDADGSAASDSFASHRWYELVAAMWAAQAHVLEAGRLGMETATLFERRGPQQGRSDTWTQYPYRAELVERLARQGLDPDFVGSLTDAMPASFRDWPKRWGATTWIEVFEITQKRGVDLGAWIRGSVLVAADIPERRRALESLLPDGGELHPLGGEIPCAALPEPWSGVCAIGMTTPLGASFASQIARC